MGNRWVAVCLALLALPLGSISPVSSQDAAPTPGPSTAFAPLEFDMASDDLPVTVSRIALGEGEGLPFGDRHGPALVLVADGELSFDSSDVHVLASESPGASSVATPPAANPGLAGTGDLLSVPADADVTLAAGSKRPAALIVLELGETIDQATLSKHAGVTPLATDTVQLGATRIRLDIRRLTLAQWATTDVWPTDLAQVVIIENGALALEIEGGLGQIGRAYGSQETLVAATGEDSANPEADPQAHTEAGEETASNPTPPVPPLNGTVAGLATGDVAIVSGAGGIELQGVSEQPATVLSVSLAAVDAG